MTVERALPVYEIYGTKFLVDIELLELREVNDPENRMSFLNMDDMSTHYEIDYDRAEKNIVPYDYSFHDLNDIANVKIPPLKELDPEGMAAKYGCSIEEMKGKTDFEIMVDQQSLNNRLAGALPEIDLAGDKFFVDWRLKELRAKDDMLPTPLNLKTMDMNSDGTAYICAYHIPSKSEYQLDVSTTELPKDVVILEIPYELKLDPVGVAREHGLKDTTLLRRFPIQQDLKAKVVPLSQTDLPKLIENNKMKQQDQQARQSQPKGRKIR